MAESIYPMILGLLLQLRRPKRPRDFFLGLYFCHLDAGKWTRWRRTASLAHVLWTMTAPLCNSWAAYSVTHARHAGTRLSGATLWGTPVWDRHLKARKGLCAVLLCYVMSGATSAVLARKRRNVSAVPMAPRVFKPVQSRLAYPGLCEQGWQCGGETAGTLSRISDTPDFASLSHSNLGSVTPKVLLFCSSLVNGTKFYCLQPETWGSLPAAYCSQTQKLPILLLTYFQNLFSTSPFSLTWAISSFDLLPKIIMKQSIPSILVFLHANLPELS